MEAASACCTGLRKNFGGHIALPIRTRNTNARSFIKPPNAHESEHTTATSRSRYFKVQEGALAANLQIFPRINNPTNTLKPCANQSTEGHVQESVERKAQIREEALCEMWGLRVVSNPSTQPYPLNLSSSSFARPDSRGRLSPHGRLWRVLPLGTLK